MFYKYSVLAFKSRLIVFSQSGAQFDEKHRSLSGN